MKKKETLTKIQANLLNVIKEYIEKNGFSPTIRELCQLTGKKSPATIKVCLDVLLVKGYITYIPKTNRTIRIVNEE